MREIHIGLANSSMFFIAALGIWALVLRFRSFPLNASWFGAAVIGEVVILAQVGLGLYLAFEGLGALPRPFLHYLYGVVAALTLPAAYGYFSQVEDENVKTLAMALTCFFLWGLLVRASSVAYISPVG